MSMKRVIVIAAVGVYALLACTNGMAQTGSGTVPAVDSETGPAAIGSPLASPATGTPDTLGIHWGPLRVSGGLDVGIYHDSNPTYASGNGSGGAVRGDTAMRAEPSLDMFLKGNGWDSYLRGWYLYDWYLNPSSGAYKDTVSQQHYGETFGVNMESARGTRVSFTEFYEFQNRNDTVNEQDPSGNTYNGSWQDRQSLILGASINEPLGEKTGLSAGVNMNDLGYDSAALYDWASISGTLGLTRKLTSKTDAVLDLGYGVQQSEGTSGDSGLWSATMGIGSRATSTATYKVEVGLMGYRYNNGEYNAVSPTYNVSGAWTINRRLSASLNGTANYQPSEVDKNNYTLVQSLSGGLNYLATRRLTTTLGGVFRREDFGRPFQSDPNQPAENRLDNQFSIYSRADYRLQRNTSVFVVADFSKNSSSINTLDYNRLFLEAGVSLRF